MDEESPMDRLLGAFRHVVYRNTGEELRTLMETIEETRQRYKTLVDEHYKTNEPFPRNRQDCNENFVTDIERYLELVGHCIVAGDPNILYRWGINFLEERDGLLKLASSDLAVYQQVFEERRQDSESTREKIYMDILIDKFKVLAERSARMS